MRRFMLTIDLGSTVETFEDIVHQLDVVRDRLKLVGDVEPHGGVGGTIRDERDRVVGSWEIQEDSL